MDAVKKTVELPLEVSEAAAAALGYITEHAAELGQAAEAVTMLEQAIRSGNVTDARAAAELFTAVVGELIEDNERLTAHINGLIDELGDEPAQPAEEPVDETDRPDTGTIQTAVSAYRERLTELSKDQEVLVLEHDRLEEAVTTAERGLEFLEGSERAELERNVQGLKAQCAAKRAEISRIAQRREVLDKRLGRLERYLRAVQTVAEGIEPELLETEESVQIQTADGSLTRASLEELAARHGLTAQAVLVASLYDLLLSEQHVLQHVALAAHDAGLSVRLGWPSHVALLGRWSGTSEQRSVLRKLMAYRGKVGYSTFYARTYAALPWPKLPLTERERGAFLAAYQKRRTKSETPEVA